MADVAGAYSAPKQDSPQAQPHHTQPLQQEDVSPPGEEAKYITPEESAPASPSNELRSAPLPRPRQKSRARSSSSGMLARLTSRSSSHNTDQLVDESATSHASTDSAFVKPKLDRAALAKPRGKYKSGVNWDSSPMNLAAGEEPFMEQISPSFERTKEELEDSMKAAELEQMAAAGSTKAALAWARANSFGDPIFTNHRRAMADASAKAAHLSSSPPSASVPMRMKSSSSTRSAVENGRSSNLRFNGSEMNGISEDAASREQDKLREASQSLHGRDLIAGVGQAVLDSARKAAADSNDAQEIQPVDEIPPSPSPDVSVEEAQKATKIAKRRTFLGFGGGKKKKGKDTVTPEEPEADDEGETNFNEIVEQPNREVNREDEVRTPGGGTGSRRRRFNDTRQLHLLASELAAEAMMGVPDNYPSLMPEARRASMMSMLAATNGDTYAMPSNTSSQISLQLKNLAMPQPAFASDYYRSGSPAGGSSRSGSPRLMGSDSPRLEPPRAHFARSQQSLNSPIAPLASQKAKLSGLPSDMLTGLGDGPYPSLSTRGTESSDASMPPMALDEQSYQGGRNSMPDSFASRSRVASASSIPLPKRSVLQMSMHNPDSELQGLTKPPKSARSTPFGSRAPSKQVTPHASFGNLREKANSAVSPTLLSQELAKSEVFEDALSQAGSPNEEGRLNVHTGLINESSDEVKSDSKKKAKEARRSLFGRKSKSNLVQTQAEKKSGDQLLAPPSMPQSSSKAQSLHSTNGGPIRVVGGIGARLRGASRSAQSLVKVPSPTQSNATTSASSHDRGAFNYSSDGGSQQQGFSAVSTPEALPAKLELTSIQPPPIESLYPIAANGNSLALPVGKTSLQPPKASPTMPAPRSMSATSKSSTNTLGRMNKLKSMFAAKSSTGPPRTSPTSTNLYNSINEKGTAPAAGSPLSNGTSSPNDGVPTTTREKQLKFLKSRFGDKMLI